MNWLHPPQTCFGLKVVVREDQPRMQLSTAPCVTKYGNVVEWISPAMRDEINAWMRDFFGMTNLMKDGDYLVMEQLGIVTMNRRTYLQFRKALEKNYAAH